MAKRFEVYQCSICGNMVEAVADAPGKLVCCGKPMDLLIENTTDASLEKHVPVYSREGNAVTIKVGSIPHPMTPEHFIEWIELLQNGRTQRVDLAPGDRPIAEFCVADGPAVVRALCNRHGLWKADVPAAREK